jgi:hypothetical protein
MTHTNANNAVVAIYKSHSEAEASVKELQRSSIMKTVAGMWIDHREAVIVLVSGKRQVTKRIKSYVEKQLRRSGRSPSRDPFEAQRVPAEAILLFGPGEAKGELRKRIERNKLDLRITCLETADKMTERQISQKVARHYSPANPARPLGRGNRR